MLAERFNILARAIRSKMVRDGVTFDEAVAVYTNLTVDEIAALRAELED